MSVRSRSPAAVQLHLRQRVEPLQAGKPREPPGRRVARDRTRHGAPPGRTGMQAGSWRTALRRARYSALIVDTSALIAILRDEPDAESFARTLAAARSHCRASRGRPCGLPGLRQGQWPSGRVEFRRLLRLRAREDCRPAAAVQGGRLCAHRRCFRRAGARLTEVPIAANHLSPGDRVSRTCSSKAMRARIEDPDRRRHAGVRGLGQQGRQPFGGQAAVEVGDRLDRPDGGVHEAAGLRSRTSKASAL